MENEKVGWRESIKGLIEGKRKKITEGRKWMKTEEIEEGSVCMTKRIHKKQVIDMIDRYDK